MLVRTYMTADHRRVFFLSLVKGKVSIVCIEDFVVQLLKGLGKSVSLLACRLQTPPLPDETQL